MKKIAIFIIIILLVPVSVTMQAGPQSVEVEWNLAGCWLDLDVSPFYRIAPIGGTTYNVWEPGQIIEGNTPHEVTARSSCRGYSVDVEATSFDLPA